MFIWEADSIPSTSSTLNALTVREPKPGAGTLTQAFHMDARDPITFAVTTASTLARSWNQEPKTSNPDTLMWDMSILISIFGARPNTYPL